MNYLLKITIHQHMRLSRRYSISSVVNLLIIVVLTVALYKLYVFSHKYLIEVCEIFIFV